MIFREILDRQLSNDSLVQQNFIINIYVRYDRAYIILTDITRHAK